MIFIEFEGKDELILKLRLIQRMAKVKAAILAVALHIKGKINIYPPGSAANSSGNRRWYERGYGPRWRRVDGSVGGRKTSEMLGRKWTAKTTGELSAEVGNNVSYAVWVHDPEKQASFHKARGWKTTQEVADQEAATANRLVEEAIRSEIRAAGLD